jgi:hypothetical protein
MSAIMLERRSSIMDITAAGIAGISHCLFGFGYFNMLMLVVPTDGRWKLAATYFNTIRCWHDGVD